MMDLANVREHSPCRTAERPIEVLAALALAPGRVLHREELIDRLWPDKDLDAGANKARRRDAQ
jgi:DNA-binding winged helix-turn-helix (wHTH) protein